MVSAARIAWPSSLWGAFDGLSYRPKVGSRSYTQVPSRDYRMLLSKKQFEFLVLDPKSAQTHGLHMMNPLGLLI